MDIKGDGMSLARNDAGKEMAGFYFNDDAPYCFLCVNLDALFAYSIV